MNQAQVQAAADQVYGIKPITAPAFDAAREVVRQAVASGAFRVLVTNNTASVVAA